MDTRDGCHAAARRFWLQLLESRTPLLITDYILDEALTLLRRRRKGLDLAKALYDILVRSRKVELVEVDATLRQAGWELLVTYQDQVLSFTDCTSFALLRRRNLSEVFTFDEDFARVGFVMRPS